MALLSLVGLLACSDPPPPTLLPWKTSEKALARDAALLPPRSAPSSAASGAPSSAPDPRPDVLVIVLDTVRADHLGLYGYDRDTSPHLDAWAANARVYTHAQSVAPWTLPSHASLFTGLWPADHGAEGTPLGASAPARPLPPTIPTLAEAFRAAGYQTAALASNRAFLQRSWGLDRGFSLYLCDQLAPGRAPYIPADRMIPLAQRWLAQSQGGAPRFLFLNLMDAHSPWFPREGFVRDARAIQEDVLPGGARWGAVTEALMAKGSLDEATRRAWVEAYDSELRFLDHHLRALLDDLPRLGVGPEDLVVILSDHGEYLGEHSLIEHSKDVYQQALHVPLIVRGPGFAPGRDDTPTQTLDLPHTILAAVGLPALSPPPDRPTLPGQPPVSVSTLYWTRWRDLSHPAYGPRFDRLRYAFLAGPHKLILGSDGSREAYDLSSDPQEATSTPSAAWVEPLEAAARAWIAAHPPPSGAAGAVSAEGMEALRKLGYVE